MELGPCPTPSAPRRVVKINSGLFGNLIACSAQNKRLRRGAAGGGEQQGAARGPQRAPGGTRGGSRLGSSRLWAGGTWSPRGAPGMVPSPRHQAQVTSTGPRGAAAGRPSVCPLATVRLAALVLNLLIPGGIFSAPKGRAKSGGGSAAAPWPRGEGLHIRCLDPKTQHPQSPKLRFQNSLGSMGGMRPPGCALRARAAQFVVPAHGTDAFSPRIPSAASWWSQPASRVLSIDPVDPKATSIPRTGGG